MPRSWSNAKLPPPPSPAERARSKPPTGVTIFLVLLVIVTVFFAGITFYTAYKAERHPPTSAYQNPADHPKDE